AAHHDAKIPALRAFLAPADGSVEHVGAELREAARHLTDEGGSARGGLDEDRVAGNPVEDTVRTHGDARHLLRPGQRGEHDVRPTGDLGGGGGARGPQRLGGGRGGVPQRGGGGGG